MRKITEEAHRAFMHREKFKKGNTEVRITNGLPQMYLHNNKIAEMNSDGEVCINTCGWMSRTTRERLNAFIPIRVEKGSFIVNEKFKWDGSWLNITRI
jgi:hypothetical protein